jgi:hypothetical protein
MRARLEQRSIAAGRLSGLAGSIETVLDQHRSGFADEWWTVAQLGAALEHSVDLLLTIAVELGLDSPGGRSATTTRDTVEIHLRATIDFDPTGAGSARLTNLLVDAADQLVAEAERHRPIGRRA